MAAQIVRLCQMIVDCTKEIQQQTATYETLESEHPPNGIADGNDKTIACRASLIEEPEKRLSICNGRSSATTKVVCKTNVINEADRSTLNEFIHFGNNIMGKGSQNMSDRIAALKRQLLVLASLKDMSSVLKLRCK